MINKYTTKIGMHLLHKGLIPADEYVIYQYGLDLLFSSVLTSVSTVLLSCLIDNIFYGITYLCITIPLRMFSGGYHANTYNACFIISNGIYIMMSVTTSILLLLHMPMVGWFTILFVSAATIFIYAPVPNSHHPVSTQTLTKNKRKCRLALIIYVLLIMIFMNNNIVSQYACVSTDSILVVAILVLIPKLQKRKEGHTNV